MKSFVFTKNSYMTTLSNFKTLVGAAVKSNKIIHNKQIPGLISHSNKTFFTNKQFNSNKSLNPNKKFNILRLSRKLFFGRGKSSGKDYYRK